MMTDQSNDTHSTLEDARTAAAQKLHDARDKAAEALATSRETTKQAVHRAASEIETNPLAILAGGLAVGALVGALIPRSAKEKELLAPVGKRLSDNARQAFAAAKEAGRSELDQAGLTPGAAKDRGKDLLDGVKKALVSAGSAAAQSAKKSETAPSAAETV